MLQWIRTFLTSRLSGRPDSEHEQAIIRVILVSAVYAYLRYASSFDGFHDNNTGYLAIVIAEFYLAFSWMYFGSLLIYPGVSHARRVLGVIGDAIALSACVYDSYAIGSVLFMLYLWITLGNGFRYGNRYLFISAAVNLAGFLSVVYFSQYWRQHSTFSAGIILGMVLIPAYVSSLIRRLEDSANKAKSANTAKTRFLANMSHEMRTPLNGIIGMSSLLSDVKMEDAGRDIVKTVQASADTLLALINDVLDIAKIEQGRITIETEDFDVYRLCNNVMRMVTLQLNNNGVGAFLNIEQDVPFLLNGDSHHLRQVLINLLGNAAKFTEEGEIQLIVKRKDLSDGSPMLYFEVVDTGIGIPEASQADLFNAFKQAEDSITRRYGGTGLGTTISKELVEAMGGKIGFRSRPGEGATFWFYVPMHEPKQHDTHHTWLTNKRSLILSLDDALSTTLHRLLYGWGASIDWASTMGEALSSLHHSEHYRYDFLIVDRDFTNMDIKTLSYDLKDSLDEAGAHKVLITSRSDDTPHIDYIHAGFDVIIDKPVETSALFNGLHACLAIDDDEDDGEDSLQERRSSDRSLKIIAADDNEINRSVLSRVLMKGGHTATIVADGESAIDELQTNDYDMAILDMQMPGMSGLEVCRMVRIGETMGENMPIIILSANATPQAKEEAIESGASSFMTKPFRPEELLRRISTLTSDNQGSSDSEMIPLTSPNGDNSPSATENDVDINYSILSQLRSLSNMDDFLINISHSFDNDAYSTLNVLRDAIKTCNYAAFTDAAHALKGSALHVGGESLGKLCKDAELLDYDTFMKEGGEYVTRMGLQVRRVSATLHREFGGHISEKLQN